MKRGLSIAGLVLALAAGLQAQTCTITSPISGATWTSWTGNQFQVHLSSAPSVSQVAYFVDGVPVTNPGPPTVISGTSGALLAAGVANSPPYTFPANSYLWANGSHQASAVATDATGATVATCAPVTFTIANLWPVSCSGVAPAFSVSPGTAFGSNWSSTVPLTVTASTCTSDTIYVNVFVDGISQSSSQGPALSGGTYTWPLVTTDYPNGPHIITITLSDVTNGSSTFGTTAGEFSRTATFANTTAGTASYTVSNARRIYIAPTATLTLTPTLEDTTQTPVAGTQFAFYSNNPSAATVSWTCCTGASSTTVTGVAAGSAKVYSMAYATNFTDGTAVSTLTMHSNTIGTRPAYANGLIVISGGTNCIPGVYLMGAVNSSNGQITMQNPATLQNTPFVTTTPATCSGSVGPVAVSHAQVNATNSPVPHFLSTGGVSTSYVPGQSIVVHELFQSFSEITSQPYPVPYLSSICHSGWNALETSAFQFDASSWGTSESGFISQATAFVQKQVQLINQSQNYCSNPLFLWLTGDGAMRSGTDLYDATQGVPSGRNGSTWTHSGIYDQFTIWANSNTTAGNSHAIANTMTDEYAYNSTPMQGPITLGGTTNSQNWLGSSNSITCTSMTCTVTASTSFPGGGWELLEANNPAGGFVITNSVTPGMNTPQGTTYIATGSLATGSFTFPKPSGVAAGTYNSSNDPTLTIKANACCGWFTPPGGGSATDVLNDDALAYQAQQMDAVSGRIPAAVSIAGDVPTSTTGFVEVNCTNGNAAAFCQHQSLTVNGVPESNVGGSMTFNDQYWSQSYLNSYTNGHGAINAACNDAADISICGRLMGFYGAYDPAKPLVTLTSLVSSNYALNMTPPEKIPVASCMGNTITTSTSHHIVNLIAGATRTTISGSTDPNCNGNFVILSAPTPTTFTVARAATSQTCAGSDVSGGTCAYIQNTCSVSGTSVTWTGGTQWPSWVAGRPIKLHFGTASGTVATWNSATSLTLTTSVGSLPSSSCDVGNGGTVTFENGDTSALWSVSADGATLPMGFGTTWMDYGNISPASQTECGGSAVTSQSFVNHRGQKLKFSGVQTGAGDTYFNFAQSGIQFIYDIENVPTPIDTQGSPDACANYIREIPQLNGTGGLASIIYDGAYVQGRNPSNLGSAGNADPQWTFTNLNLSHILRAAATRGYSATVNNTAYAAAPVALGPSGAGWIGSSASAVAVYNQAGVPIQLFSHPNVENFNSNPDFWAGSTAARLWSRAGKYFLGATALNSVDYGSSLGIESATFQSSYGYLHVIQSTNNGTRTITVNLAPYETSGQNVILWINDPVEGILPLTIIPAGTSTYSLTLGYSQFAMFLFPATFAGELNEPTVSFRVADVPGSSSMAARCGYDQYLLPNAQPFSLPVPSGGMITATLPYDKIAPIYCTLSYLGSGNVLLAGGAKSAIITF